MGQLVQHVPSLASCRVEAVPAGPRGPRGLDGRDGELASEVSAS